MTLIEVRGKNGELIGRCDARCYNTKEPHCECICDGRNHGAGLQKAIEQTREQAEQWITAYADRLGLQEYEGLVSGQLFQMTIFDLLTELEREAESMKTTETIHRYKLPPGSGIEARCRLPLHPGQMQRQPHSGTKRVSLIRGMLAEVAEYGSAWHRAPIAGA